MEVFEVERMRKEIDNYIEHIIICHEKNDFEMMIGSDNQLKRLYKVTTDANQS